MGRPGPRFLLAAGSVLACAALAAPAAFGADSSLGTLVVREVDASQFPHVEIISRQSGSTAPSITVNGVAALDSTSSPIGETDRSVGIVVVLDDSAPMADTGAFDTLKTKITALAGAIPANHQLAVVRAGVSARVITQFTDGRGAVGPALANLQLSNRKESSVNDAVNLGLEMLALTPSLQGNIIVVTANSDVGGGVPSSAIRGDLINRGITLDAVTIAHKGVDQGALQALARDSRGGVFRAADGSAASAAFDAAANAVLGQRVSSITAPADAKVLDLKLSMGGLSADAFVTPGSTVVGGNVDPPGANGLLTKSPKFLEDNGKVVGLGLGTAAIMLFAVGFALVVIRDRHGLDAMLAHYGEEHRPVAVEADDEVNPSIATSQLMQRAVAFTSNLAERRGVTTWLEGALERADLPLRAGEALFFYAATSVVASLAAFVLTKSLIIGLVVAVLLALSPPSTLNFLAKRRQKKFQSMLPDVLQLLSSTLKAGYSLTQGFEAVSQEVQEPAGKEFRRIVVEARLGREFADALSDSAERMKSDDFKWAVMAIGIQREVGGNLAELLLTVADTMVQRERLRRDVKALTAEGRMSAYILGVLPIGVGLMMYSLNKAYIQTLFDKSIGHVLLGIAGFMMVGGFAWMSKMVKVEV